MADEVIVRMRILESEENPHHQDNLNKPEPRASMPHFPSNTWSKPRVT